ncbi:MAG: phenylacetate--CoA ligase family protein [Phycisphaeraceae bacterium]
MSSTDDNATQTEALRDLLRELIKGNRFYQPRLEAAGLTDPNAITLDAFVAQMPLTTKRQLIDDQQAHPPYGTNLTDPIERYTRFCQTSGTTGKPLRIIDTNASWQAMLDIWRHVFEHAGCRPGDRVLFAFSFGPFLGFWTAYEAAAQMGLMCLPGGGMTSSARLDLIQANDVSTVCCTPTYALHLAEVATREGIDLRALGVERLIVAGEPGGSIPAVRSRIETAWNATLYDHHGMTEVGPVTYQDNDRPGALRIASGAFLVEVIDPDTTEPLQPGTPGELVLTTLRRSAWPLLRYRTGDLVEQDPRDPLRLRGGILGRIDDMVLIRGVNVYPSAIDAVVRQFNEIAEYEVVLDKTQAMHELSLRIETLDEAIDAQRLCDALSAALRDALSLRIPVSAAAAGSLPRFELKAKRWREVTA